MEIKDHQDEEKIIRLPQSEQVQGHGQIAVVANTPVEADDIRL